MSSALRRAGSLSAMDALFPQGEPGAAWACWRKEETPDMSIEPWQWPEMTWRKIVGRARAGRSLRPNTWPEGTRCAVALSFDADHETLTLRDADESPMRISQGHYGARQGVPRIRK